MVRDAWCVRYKPEIAISYLTHHAIRTTRRAALESLKQSQSELTLAAAQGAGVATHFQLFYFEQPINLVVHFLQF